MLHDDCLLVNVDLQWWQNSVAEDSTLLWLHSIGFHEPVITSPSVCSPIDSVGIGLLFFFCFIDRNRSSMQLYSIVMSSARRILTKSCGRRERRCHLGQRSWPLWRPICHLRSMKSAMFMVMKWIWRKTRPFRFLVSERPPVKSYVFFKYCEHFRSS